MKRFNKIVDGFSKTIKKLENLTNTCAERIIAIQDQQSGLSQEKREQSAEASAAQNVATKLKELVGSD